MLGLKDVPVIRLSRLDQAERRAYRIADNILTEFGEWDKAMLLDEIAGLLAEDFDLSLLASPMNLDRRAVDVARHACHPLAAPLGLDASAGKFQHRLLQDFEVGRLRHQRGEP